MQTVLIAGDSLDFETSVPDYPATAGWTLSYRLIPRVSGTAITFSATANGADYRVQVAAATTAAWVAGEYSWAAFVTLGPDRFTVDSGTITIKPDPGVASASDLRSHARRALDAIEAVIENRATMDQQEYQIAGRMLKRMTVSDLLRFRDRYRAEVAAEDAARRLLGNESPGFALQVRL